jgi:hypothetical protein
MLRHTRAFLRSLAYVVTNSSDTIIRIKPDGNVTTVAGSIMSLEVAGDTTLAWVPWTWERALHVTTTGAHGAPVNGTASEPRKFVTLVLDDEVASGWQW